MLVLRSEAASPLPPSRATKFRFGGLSRRVIRLRSTCAGSLNLSMCSAARPKGRRGGRHGRLSHFDPHALVPSTSLCAQRLGLKAAVAVAAGDLATLPTSCSTPTERCTGRGVVHPEQVEGPDPARLRGLRASPFVPLRASPERSRRARPRPGISRLAADSRARRVSAASTQ